ncbi:MAG TPA: DUF3011 domain-containing protein [Rudaea sp.]|jgi:hypothetical protein|nr:DUF3011 domain-containing protein [Rudaea sp.]
MLLRWGIAFVVFAISLLPVSAVRAQGYGDSVTCESRNFNYQSCPVPWRDARLIRQTSDTQCVRGRSWGIDRRGLWVDRGCGGVFVAAGGPPGPGPGGWRPGPGWDNRFTIGCSSDNYQYRFCGVDVGGGGRVYLDRQTSGTPCVEGRSWGWNRGGVWVSGGCQGIFSVDRRWR